MFHHVRRRFTQSRNVIEYVKSAPERSEDKIVLSLLDHNVFDGDGGQAAFDLNPLFAAIVREEDAKLGAHKKKIRIHGVFRKRQRRPVLRQIAADRNPGFPGVRTLHYVGLKVAVFVVLERSVNSVGVKARSREAADVCHIRNRGKLIVLGPGRTAILRDLHQSVIRACVNQAFLHWRLAQRDNIAVERSGLVFRHGIRTPDFAHHRQFVPINLPSEISTHRAPGIATIVAAEKLIGSDVDARMRMRTDEQRRIPIPAQRRLALSGLRLDEQFFRRLLVIAHQHAILRLAVNRVGIFRIHRRMEAIAPGHGVPIGIDNAMRAARARGAAPGEIVLRAAVHVIERGSVVHRDVVKL